MANVTLNESRPEHAGNSVPQSQNHEENLLLRRAIAQIYFTAKKNLAVQVFLTVALPTVTALISILVPDLRPFVPIVAVVAVLIDLFYIDRRQRLLLKQAASAAERFDCSVLEMPWNKTATGSPVSDAIVRERAMEYRARVGSDARIVDWYPVSVGRAPMHLARVICQLTNSQYDGRLRAIYRGCIGLIGIACIAFLLLMAVSARLLVGDFLLIVLTPALPVLLWTGREFVRQLDTDGPLKDIQDRAFELWDATVSGVVSAAECAVASRSLQDRIFDYRARSPLPIPFIYSVLRGKLETKMNVSAEERLREAGVSAGSNS